MTDTQPRETLNFTLADLPTLRKLRDMHFYLMNDPDPAEMTAVQASAYRIQLRYTLEMCGQLVTELETRAART